MQRWSSKHSDVLERLSVTLQKIIFLVQNYTNGVDLCIVSFFPFPSKFLIAQKNRLKEEKKNLLVNNV